MGAGVLLLAQEGSAWVEYEYETTAADAVVGIIFGVMFLMCVCAAVCFNIWRRQQMRRTFMARRPVVVRPPQPVSVVVTQPKIVTATAVAVPAQPTPTIVTAQATPIASGQQQQQYVQQQVYGQQQPAMYAQQQQPGVYAQQPGVYQGQQQAYQQQQPGVYQNQQQQQQPYL